MNEPEATMLDATRPTNLIVTSTALKVAEEAINLVMRVPAPLRTSADQRPCRGRLPGCSAR